jgi:hypothetical protein
MSKAKPRHSGVLRVIRDVSKPLRNPPLAQSIQARLKPYETNAPFHEKP